MSVMKAPSENVLPHPRAVARTIVAMEQGYVTAAFFRHRAYERYRRMEQLMQLDDGGWTVAEI